MIEKLMQRRTAKLIEHLRTEGIGGDLYRGSSLNLGWGRVYGGQTCAQAMDACLQATEGRVVQSLSAYFVKPGKVELPIDYHVTKLSDGRSVSTRLVTGSQQGQIIFTMMASLGDPELDPTKQSQQIYHQSAQAPTITTPAASVPTLQERLEPHSDRMKNYELRRTYIDPGNPFDFRPVSFFPMWLAPKSNQLEPQASTYISMPALSQLSLENTTGLNAKLFAYASDFNFLATALRPHPIANWSPKLQIATISHSLFFHRPSDIPIDTDFLLFAKSSPIARAGRAFVLGQVYDSEGRLLVSATQEGVLRFRS